VGSHVKTVLLSPGPNLAAALAARRGPDLSPDAATVHPSRVLDKRRQPTPKVGRMLGAQVKLVRRAFQREHNRLVGRAAGQIVLQLYLKPLHRLPPKSEWPGQTSSRRPARFIPQPTPFHCWLGGEDHRPGRGRPGGRRAAFPAARY
jgi:hypothetical protein